MKRRDFLKLGALAAASAQAKQFDAAAQAIFDEQMGLCEYLYENGLYDKEFIERYTVGFDKFKDYFTGAKDGVKKDLKWASKICGVSEKELKKLADTLAKKDTLIVTGYSIQRQHHGEMAYWALITLAAMLGDIGKT